MVKSAAGKAATQRALSDDISKDNKPTSDVVEHLQRQVANAFVLYANYKHYHWQTFGPLFRDLHKLFDKFADEVLSTIDELAERIRALAALSPDERGKLGRELRERVQVSHSVDSWAQGVLDAAGIG